jgi:hypothetical protein
MIDKGMTMTTETNLQVPAGHERGIRFGANWTMIISPYMILYFIFIALAGDLGGSGNLEYELSFAGASPLASRAIALLDGLFHVLFFVTTVTLYAALRLRWPVRASLILVSGAWQMLLAFTKALFNFFAFTDLGAAYLAAGPTARAALLPVAQALSGLHTALQWMDSFGVMFVWILVSLLPEAANLPRPVRWLGWIMTFGILVPGPGFLLVVLLSPFWLFLLGRWLKGLAGAQVFSQPAMENAGI